MKGATYPLRLPFSLKKAVEEYSKNDGTSMNQFINLAIAEKLSAMNTARFFEERKARANLDEAMAILNREDSPEPIEEDRL